MRGAQPYNSRDMSLVTRCPSCATTFKVVRDQLRISDGWVRCGRCSHVFDASIDLRDLPEPTPSTSMVPALADDADFFDDEPLPEPVASAPAPLEMPESDMLTDTEFDDGDDETDQNEEEEEQEQEPYVAAHDLEPAFEREPVPTLMPARDLYLSEPVQRIEPVLFQPPLHAGAIVLPRTLPGLPSIGLVADEPWPQVVTPRFDNDNDNSDDASTAKSPSVALAPEEPAENASRVQFQKALRRARDKAAKIARSRERTAAAHNSNPMPLVQYASESDAESDAESEAVPSAVTSESTESAPVSGFAAVTLPGLLRAASAPA
ncbi:MAG: hypothetical protein JWQ73_1911, partial [Variovorax sp.]|nr:hypothetical protein [Variovorax sp.]